MGADPIAGPVRFAEYWLQRPPGEVTAEALEGFVGEAIAAGGNLAYLEPTAAPAEIAREVSAFANAEGGLLILGVEVDRPVDARGAPRAIVPRALRGLPPGGWSWDRFRREVLGAIEPPVPGVDIVPVELAGGRVALLVDVPPSGVGVHRAPDGLHYTRRGFLSVPMEPADVEALRARRGRPKLLPRVALARLDPAAGRLSLRLQLENRGRKEARDPRATLRLLRARPLGGEGARRGDVPPGAAEEIHWSPGRPVGSGDILVLPEVRVEYRGDFAAEVEVAAAGVPPERYYYLVPADVTRDVERLLSGDEGWELPPAERAEVLKWWSAEGREPLPRSPGP